MPNTITIPSQEIEVRTSRASGPGGQHVNTSSTRVEVRWNVDRSEAISDAQRRRLRARLGNRISKTGILRVVADDERSQRRNRVLAIERLHDLVRDALAVPKTRRPTRVPQRAKEARLREKKRRGDIKSQRRHPDAGEND